MHIHYCPAHQRDPKEGAGTAGVTRGTSTGGGTQPGPGEAEVMSLNTWLRVYVRSAIPF